MYDRVADTDVRLRTDDQISAIYLRKRNRYTEQRIYPYLTLDCLQLDLLQEARHRAVQKRAGHPWATMTDEDLLKIFSKARVSTHGTLKPERGAIISHAYCYWDVRTLLAVSAQRIKLTPSCAEPMQIATMIGSL